jgi:FkbM family methyltransferase
MIIRILLVQRLIQIIEALTFYPQLKRFYKKQLANKPLFVLDVGANKGQSIDFFLSLNNKSVIHSFEPNIILHKQLVEKYKLNRNITIHNLGVSSSNGEKVFYVNIMDETSTFEPLNSKSKYLDRKGKILGVGKDKLIIDEYLVKTIKLSDFIEKTQTPFYDTVKIDVEGHELDCLIGLFGETLDVLPINFIQMEIHNDDMYLKKNLNEQIDDLLVRNNFVLAAKIKHRFGDFEELIYQNLKYYDA